MGSNYSSVFYRDDFTAAIKQFERGIDRDFDGQGDETGDAWLVVAMLLDEKDAEIAELKTRLAEQETKIEKLHANVDVLREDKNWYDGIIRGRGEEIARLEAEVEKLDNALWDFYE